MENKILNIKSVDTLDILILEDGLRIKSFFSDKENGLLILILSSGKIIKSRLSNFPRLEQATQKQLDDYRLVGSGIGINWEELDEDLSLKGFIRETAINNIVKQLRSKDMEELVLI